MGDATLRELMASIVPVRQVVLIGSEAAGPPISYGLQVVDAHLELASGRRKSLAVLGLSTETVTSVAALARPLWIGSSDALGLLQLAQSLFMDIERGETFVFERALRVEDRLDVAGFTDRTHAREPRVHGQLSPPIEGGPASVLFRNAAGSAVSQVRPDSTGNFALHLPPGSYALEARAPGGRRAELAVEVADRTNDVDLGEIALPAAAWIEIPPELAPVRLAFRGEAGTADPLFGDDQLGFRLGNAELPPMTAASDLQLGGFDGDPQRVPIAPGKYRVYATRGPEFAVTEERIEVTAGTTHRLQLEAPMRLFETPQWIAADLHVHAAPSDDSPVPLRRRIASFLAEGGEILVATDHDNVTDYAPLIAELGLRDRLRSVVGLEVTSVVSTPAAPHTAGHSNVFPLPYRPELPRGGALPSESLRLRGIIAAAHSLPGLRIVQLNHGREQGAGAISNEGAFLSHLSIGRSFDPNLALEADANRSLLQPDPKTGLRDLDFDAMELINGPSIERYRLLRADWISLLRQGHPKTATANSDTHSLQRVAAMPRTYVRMANDSPGAFNEEEFVRSLRRGAAWGTTGPLLEVQLGETRPGGLFVGKTGTLRVSVRAAPWVPLSQLRVAVDGELVHARTIQSPVDLELPIEVERDAFVTVEVEGRSDALYGALLPGFTPLAFTNAIFIDADGDGTWTPPGLGE
jgi:hypothetical protein